MNDPSGELDFARDLFAGLGCIEGKRLFGVLGLYLDGVIFGLINDGTIYLKTDAALKDAFVDAGSQPWVFVAGKGAKAGVAQEMPYWSLPDEASDDPEDACAWGRRALAVARATASLKAGR